jgi:predicted O-methyltransferase YrrM
MDRLIQMRPEESEKGLLSMIEYINNITPTSNMSMIEIGSYAGESTKIFCKNFKDVISIDPYMEEYDMNDAACHNMKLGKVYDVFIESTFDIKNLKHIRKTSDDAVINFRGRGVDLVYIDGIHTYEQVKKDIQNYLPHIKIGGFISGHDYHPHWSGVVKAVDEVLGKPDKVFEDYSWVKRI